MTVVDALAGDYGMLGIIISVTIWGGGVCIWVGRVAQRGENNSKTMEDVVEIVRALPTLSQKVDVLCAAPEFVTKPMCDETCGSLAKIHTLELNHVKEQFLAMKELLEKIERQSEQRDESSSKRHERLMLEISNLRRFRASDMLVQEGK